MIRKPQKVSMLLLSLCFLWCREQIMGLENYCHCPWVIMGIRTYLKLVNAEFPALAWAWMIYCKLLMPRECFALTRGVGVGAWVSCEKSIPGGALCSPRTAVGLWTWGCCYKQANTNGDTSFFSSVLVLIWVRGNVDVVDGHEGCLHELE